LGNPWATTEIITSKVAVQQKAIGDQEYQDAPLLDGAFWANRWDSNRIPNKHRRVGTGDALEWNVSEWTLNLPTGQAGFATEDIRYFDH
jgi:hypothetical protein